MAKYKDLVGTAVRDIAGEDGVVTGQLWYDTNANEYKYRQQFAGDAWSTQPALNTARNNVSGATAGTTSATLAFGGFVPPHTGATESWNGSGWTEVNDLNTARNNAAGAGTSTSALCIAGYDATNAAVSIVESWNGSSWTETGDVNTARSGIGGTGATNDAALAFGGESPGTAAHADTESWNGSSWTEVNNLNTGRDAISAGIGTYTAALAAGGNVDSGPSTLANTETWDGTNWTEVGDMTTARKTLAGSGTNTDGLVFGGRTAPGAVQALTEAWNGTSWAEKTDMNKVQSLQAGSGTRTAALSFGGYDGTSPGNTGDTEEFNGNVAVGAWLTGANLNTTRRGLNAQNVGTQTAAMAIGGFQPPRITNTELYNGTSWSEVNDINRARFNGGGVGVQTSALYFGGSSGFPSPENPGFTREAKNELWNGYTWTEVGDMNVGRSDTCGAGANNTAALCVAGKNPASNPPGGLLAIVESWNGSSWTEVGDLNDNKESLSCVGTQTAALAIGGNTATDYVGQTESWNGSSWTELNDMNTGRSGANASGDSTSALNFGGYTGTAYTGSSELWNGTNWSNVSDLNTVRGQLGGAQGSSTAGLAFGGYTGTANTNATEEWNGTGLVTTTVTTTSD